MASYEPKDLGSPDETRTFEKGKLELVNIGGGTVGRLTLEPGWRWSQHGKPIAKTEWGEAPHSHGRRHGVRGRARRGYGATIGTRRLGRRERARCGGRLARRQQLRQGV